MAKRAAPGTTVPDRPHGVAGLIKRQARRSDYTGAVYGSLLAASVIVGAGIRSNATPPGKLAVLVLATGVVFWLAHVYARLVGDPARGPITGGRVRAVARHEWPLVEAAFPPAAAWLALGLAVTGQVGWAMVGSRFAGGPWPVVVAAGAGNLVLGLLIVALKVALSH
jgi:hypothetical protein